MKLYELNNDGTKLSVKAQANFARGEMAHALRRAPYQVNVLLGGWDEKAGASLFYIDHYAAMQKVKYGCHGYAAYFCLSMMDRDYRDGLNEQDAIQIVQHCIKNLKKRFLLSLPNFIIKVIDKDGIRVVHADADPNDN